MFTGGGRKSDVEKGEVGMQKREREQFFEERGVGMKEWEGKEGKGK